MGCKPSKEEQINKKWKQLYADYDMQLYMYYVQNTNIRYLVYKKYLAIKLKHNYGINY